MKHIIIGILSGIGILVVASASWWVYSAAVHAEEPKSLEAVEVREYQSENLSSVKDFRENSIKGPQYIDMESYTLEVGGLVRNPRTYTYDEVLENQHYEKVVTLNCVTGWSVKILWEGVLLKDLLKEVDVLSTARVVIFYAYDGYSTSLSLKYIIDNDIIMAHKMNGVTLPPERGFPFQLVAQDKWGYKWIKWITKIELSDDTDYQGYWEQSGFSNTGNLNEGFLD